MTKLEQRITQIAQATGRNVYLGRHGHKDGWFAGCADTEIEAGSASAALESLVGILKRKAAEELSQAKIAASRQEAVNTL